MQPSVLRLCPCVYFRCFRWDMRYKIKIVCVCVCSGTQGARLIAASALKPSPSILSVVSDPVSRVWIMGCSERGASPQPPLKTYTPIISEKSQWTSATLSSMQRLCVMEVINYKLIMHSHCAVRTAMYDNLWCGKLLYEMGLVSVVVYLVISWRSF